MEKICFYKYIHEQKIDSQQGNIETHIVHLLTDEHTLSNIVRAASAYVNSKVGKLAVSVNIYGSFWFRLRFGIFN